MSKRVITIEDTTGEEHFYTIDSFKTLLSIASVQNPNNVRYVSPTFSSGTPYFTSIQSAINDITGAGVVIVFAGTYTENITIKDDVSVYCHRGVVLKQNGTATACVTFAGSGNLLGEAVIDYGSFSSAGNQKAIYVAAGSSDAIRIEIDRIIGNLYYTPSVVNANTYEWGIHLYSCDTAIIKAKEIISLATNSLMSVFVEVGKMHGTLRLEGITTTATEIHIAEFFGDVMVAGGKHNLYVTNWRKGTYFSTNLVPQLWAGDGILTVHGAYINRAADAGSFCINDNGTNSKGRVFFRGCYFNFSNTCYIFDGHTSTRSSQRGYFHMIDCKIFSSYTHIARVRYALTCHFQHCLLKNKSAGAGNIAGIQTADARFIVDNSVMIVSGTSTYAIQSLDAPTARGVYNKGHCMTNLGTGTDILWNVGGTPYTQTTAELAWYGDVEY